MGNLEEERTLRVSKKDVDMEVCVGGKANREQGLTVLNSTFLYMCYGGHAPGEGGWCFIPSL